MAITFPSSPTNGQKFTSGTVTYVYSSATGAWSATLLSTALPFNYFINPSMQVQQEVIGTLVLGGPIANLNRYGADQWRVNGVLSAITWYVIVSRKTDYYPYRLAVSCYTGPPN